MMVHELGHLVFGWGLTNAPTNKNDWWFSFGMGLLYDRLAWNEIYHISSPSFDKIVSTWSNHFSKMKDLDQRLISPNVTKDKNFSLQRLQTFGHGKSMIYLTAFRNRLGHEKFDKFTNQFIGKFNQISDYDQFLELFSVEDKKEISILEKEFVIR